jgi:hypothetical protein
MVLVLGVASRALRLPPTPCRVCFRPCVFLMNSLTSGKKTTHCIRRPAVSRSKMKPITDVGSSSSHCEANREEIEMGGAARPSHVLHIERSRLAEDGAPVC